MEDCAVFQETLLQWISSSPTAREIDRELGDLRHDLLAGVPLITYQRYNIALRQASVQNLDPSLTDSKLIESLSAMDAPENMKVLHKLGVLAAERDVKSSHFAATFDLPSN